MRSTIDQVTHQPCIYIYDTEERRLKKILVHPMATIEEVLRIEKAQQEKERNEKLEALVEGLKGQIEIGGKNAEKYTSDKTRKKKELSWKQWGMRFNNYLKHIEFIINPDLIIIGGGASNKFKKFKKYLKISTKIVTADTKNEAGIIGAAIFASFSSN